MLVFNVKSETGLCKKEAIMRCCVIEGFHGRAAMTSFLVNEGEGRLHAEYNNKLTTALFIWMNLDDKCKQTLNPDQPKRALKPFSCMGSIPR